MTKLSQESCIACRGDEPALSQEEASALVQELDDWEIHERRNIPRLRRRFRFPDFATALDFTNQVGQEAERADHHPRLVTEWGRVTAEWWTHAIGGLHRNDFIMAARSDELYAKRLRH